MKNNNVTINIDNRTVVRLMIVIVAFFLGLEFLSAVRPALTLIFISAFLAVAVNPPVTYLTSRIAGGSRMAATAIAYLVVMSFIGLFLYVLVPPLISQSRTFVDKVPEYVDTIQEEDNFVSDIVNRYDLGSEIDEIGGNLQDRLGDVSGPVFSSIGRVLTAIVSIVTVLVLTFLMLTEGPGWIDRFWQLHPAHNRKHRQQLAKRMYHVITGYVNGQLVIATLSAMSSLVAMLILGIPFALPLAGLVGLFSLIPLVGATLGAGVVVLVGLFQSLTTAIILAVFFLVYQQIENNVIQPIIQSKALDVSPLLVLVAVILGISVGGLLGGFIAIPVAACVRILMLDAYERRQNSKVLS